MNSRTQLENPAYPLAASDFAPWTFSRQEKTLFMIVAIVVFGVVVVLLVN